MADPGKRADGQSMFRKAVATLEGVKAGQYLPDPRHETVGADDSDAVFSYQLPFNLVAVIFMWPMSYILNPRW